MSRDETRGRAVDRPSSDGERRRRGRSRAARRTADGRSEVASPRAAYDELEIRTRDGAALRAVVLDPPDGVALRATIVLAHAMFARKSSFGSRSRQGLSSALAARGFRTVAFDFRGHGDSTAPPSPGGFTYDDLVRHDLPAVVECARARGEGKPVVVVGHSLGGHVALAAQGTRRIAADAIVAVAANVWLRRLERSRVRWAAKTVVARATLAVSERLGGVPARRLRLGTDDAPRPYIADLFRGVTSGAWASLDGADDYLRALSEVKVPVAAVLGERDRLLCHPSAGQAFARRCAGRVAAFRAPVGHMALVTSERGWRFVLDAIEWVLRG